MIDMEDENDDGDEGERDTTDADVNEDDMCVARDDEEDVR